MDVEEDPGKDIFKNTTIDGKWPRKPSKKKAYLNIDIQTKRHELYVAIYM